MKDFLLILLILVDWYNVNLLNRFGPVLDNSLEINMEAPSIDLFIYTESISFIGCLQMLCCHCKYTVGESLHKLWCYNLFLIATLYFHERIMILTCEVITLVWVVLNLKQSIFASIEILCALKYEQVLFSSQLSVPSTIENTMGRLPSFT